MKFDKSKVTANFALLTTVVALCQLLIGCNEDISDENPITYASRHTTRSAEGLPRYFTYPPISDIMNAQVVKDSADLAWSKTIEAAAERRERTEYGFWIYVDYMSGRFYCGKLIEGIRTSSSPNARAEVEMGHWEKRGGTVVACATFHTHPPFWGQENDYNNKGVGPSDDDEEGAYACGFPGLVYDYKTFSLDIDSIYRDPYLYNYGPDSRIGLMFSDN